MAKDAFEMPDFDMPDMGDLARQMENAMAEAQKAMEGLPVQMEELGDVMGALSGLMGGLPDQLGELSSAVAGFDEQHEANAESLAGEPDWALSADVRVGEKLHVIVRAAFDLGQIMDAWQSTQGAGFESLVAGVVAGTGDDVDAGMLSQITDQLRKGRSMAIVQGVEVLTCRIQGAPANAVDTLMLSPEAGIPLSMGEAGMAFEFAPLLTIRNQWEHANIPTFVPMGEEIVVPSRYFECGEAFGLEFLPTGQDDELAIVLDFEPLRVGSRTGEC